MPHNDQVLFAQVALTTMGLTRGFGRLVVLCAHGSTTVGQIRAASASTSCNSRKLSRARTFCECAQQNRLCRDPGLYRC